MIERAANYIKSVWDEYPGTAAPSERIRSHRLKDILGFPQYYGSVMVPDIRKAGIKPVDDISDRSPEDVIELIEKAGGLREIGRRMDMRFLWGKKYPLESVSSVFPEVDLQRLWETSARVVFQGHDYDIIKIPEEMTVNGLLDLYFRNPYIPVTMIVPEDMDLVRKTQTAGFDKVIIGSRMGTPYYLHDVISEIITEDRKIALRTGAKDPLSLILLYGNLDTHPDDPLKLKAIPSACLVARTSAWAMADTAPRVVRKTLIVA